ncbi:hypothetical protein CAPTEDRAFT_213329 [Capitella teleta]|uniref:Uncharacterized protein n=1 Tax=Capitella teleta TaxID=283909 RepID=R7TPP0_CAPTE|nr:hypothetical protein CAPTEDRAFT_213329 [Capitella teleta]|eukprot:ELT95629.1 hypothetical protein CAPTEDRAFT_213329 [Capitella teleta]
MANSHRPFRPEMDWTMDADLPHRFKQWKRQIKNEVRLLMAGDSSKGEAYACTMVLVCAGEQGEDIIDQAGLSGERSDHMKLIKCLEDHVTCLFVNISESEKLSKLMIPNYNASKKITHLELKQFLLRNFLLVGLKHRDVLKDCQMLKEKECTAEHIIQLALRAEYRETANTRMSKTVNSSSASTALQDIMSGSTTHVKRISPLIAHPPTAAPQTKNQPTMHDIKALRYQVKLPVIQEKSFTHVIIDSIRHPLATTKDYITEIFKEVFDEISPTWHRHFLMCIILATKVAEERQWQEVILLWQ